MPVKDRRTVLSPSKEIDFHKPVGGVGAVPLKLHGLFLI
jgi:hypothetical protein